jgi:hypothetical protein
VLRPTEVVRVSSDHGSALMNRKVDISLDAENPTDYYRIYRAAKESDSVDLGYARVSTREQGLTGQIAELQAAGCAKIYSEKASGARGVPSSAPRGDRAPGRR